MLQVQTGDGKPTNEPAEERTQQCVDKTALTVVGIIGVFFGTGCRCVRDMLCVINSMAGEESQRALQLGDDCEEL